MIDALIDCAAWLRRAGVDVPLSATVDATEALKQVDLARAGIRIALAATLVKPAEDLDAFGVAFDVAEGMEHARQQEILARLGCDSVQGYH